MSLIFSLVEKEFLSIWKSNVIIIFLKCLFIAFCLVESPLKSVYKYGSSGFYRLVAIAFIVWKSVVVCTVWNECIVRIVNILLELQVIM